MARSIPPQNIETKHLNNGRLFKSWGCDAYGDDVNVLVEDEAGNLSRQPPCFGFETTGEQLSERSIDWASYSAEPSQAGYIWQAYSAIDQVSTTRSCGTSTSGRSKTCCAISKPAPSRP